MAKYFLGALLLFSTSLFAQTDNPKVKVILIGTFHYGYTPDKNKTAFADLFSTKRQAELNDIAQKLTKAGVTKFYLETPTERQSKLDSLYTLYKQQRLTDTTALRNEEVQIAFRTAVLNNAKLLAVDFKLELPYEEINRYEQAHKNDTVNTYPFFDVKYPFTLKQKKLPEMPLADYYIQLNNPYNRQAHMFDYLHYAPGYGKGTDYTGERLTLAWYDRNLKIFTNILRNTDVAKDKVIAVLFGSSHTALLRHFFEDHPYFEIVELDHVLK